MNTRIKYFVLILTFLLSPLSAQEGLGQNAGDNSGGFTSFVPTFEESDLQENKFGTGKLVNTDLEYIGENTIELSATSNEPVTFAVNLSSISCSGNNRTEGVSINSGNNSAIVTLKVQPGTTKSITLNGCERTPSENDNSLDGFKIQEGLQF